MRANSNVLLVSGASLSIHGGRERWVMEVAKILKDFCPTTVVSLVDRHNRVASRSKLVQVEMRSSGVLYHEIGTVKLNLKVIKRIPLSFHKLLRIMVFHQKIYVAGDIFLGILFSFLALFLGKRGLILGLHVSPSINRLYYALPLLKILDRFHVVKAIHVVNIADLVRLMKLVRLKVIYLPNFVNCAVFKPITAKRDDVFQVLFVGALDFKKGIDIFLKVAEHFKRSIKDAKFVIASYGGPLESIILKHVENSLIDYKGFVTGEELIKLYSESHVLVMPSREESFGLVAIEAQACGTPVISSDLPSFQLTVKESVTGFRVKNYEVEEWLKALQRMYAIWKFDKQAYTLMCSEAREHVCENFYLNAMRSIARMFLDDNFYK